jgi:uncharacterized membrane protein YgcG
VYNSERYLAWLAKLLLIALLLMQSAFADERILSYNADIRIESDGSINVTETIEVMAEGQNIRRGIYRDFPTVYTDRFGNRHRTTFDPLSVSRNGQSEAWHTEQRSNGIRVYAGSRSSLVETGRHRYTIVYHSKRQLGFFEDFDELYWNVTGNGWVFPIDRASATVHLPELVSYDALATDFYTGPQGAKGKHAEVSVVNGRTIEFFTTRPLAAYEGLTIAVAFPKGLVPEPTLADRFGWFLKDNSAAIALLLGLVLPLLWYLWSWNKHGRDPATGTIIPRFKPPSGLSPAGCRYVLKMSLDKNAFTAAIISLAVKGWLEIIESGDDYTLVRQTDTTRQVATVGEQAVLAALFPDDKRRIELDNENHARFRAALSALNSALKKEHVGQLFQLNTIFAAPALVMTLLAVVTAFMLQGSVMLWVLFAILSIALHAVFLNLLRAPTISGRRIMDEIEGFKMYLNTGEQDRLDHMRSPQLTPEVFEHFLPYAYALGVENHWCERFSRELPQMQDDRNGYQPRWYHGRHRGFNSLSHLGSQFGSQLSSAISSASSPPGSSSGSGGGGSSGGGGGGGGGGGW